MSAVKKQTLKVNNGLSVWLCRLKQGCVLNTNALLQEKAEQRYHNFVFNSLLSGIM